MNHDASCIRREAYQWLFTIVWFEDYTVTKNLIEVGLLKFALNELKNGNNLVFETATDAANLIFWTLMVGEKTK